MKQLLALDPTTYKRHMIHGENRTWAETNCYSDVIIELLHALGHEPRAALAFTLGIDFEGDQWTFFKFPHADLFDLFGLDIQELAVWRPLVAHIEEQVGLGRPVLVELDSYFLPDTAGTAYKLAHVKSTIAVNKIDSERKYLGYFHNQGYHALEGQDFVDIFQLEGLVHERMLPPYIEFVKSFPSPAHGTSKHLFEVSLRLLKKHVLRTPPSNPFLSFKKKFVKDLEWLTRDGIEAFHAYSFATLRQYGACFELTGTYMKWLQDQGQADLEKPIEAFQLISETTKSLQFQLARAIARGKTLDVSPLDSMAAHWKTAMDELTRRFG